MILSRTPLQPRARSHVRTRSRAGALARAKLRISIAILSFFGERHGEYRSGKSRDAFGDTFTSGKFDGETSRAPSLIAPFAIHIFTSSKRIENKHRHMEDFEYVIRKPEKQRICFGSGRPRDTSKKGMSPFMRCHTLEDYPNIGPGSYDILESFNAIKSKPCSRGVSKKGYSGLARFARPVAHVEDYPSPSDYNIAAFPKCVKPQKYPFASTSERRVFDVNKNPGPGMYVSTKITGITFQHSFGGRVKMQLGVDIKCCSRNTDTCKICCKIPIGDYWHMNDKIFLCRACMTKEFQEQVKFKKKELKLFRKIRDCSNIHIHEGTDAKIWLIHPAIVKQWMRREAYLSAYLKD